MFAVENEVGRFDVAVDEAVNMKDFKSEKAVLQPE